MIIMMIYSRTTSVTDETDFISLENLGRCLQIIAARQGIVISMNSFELISLL